ncbi:MAG: FtsX-like permease family protein [Rhodothermales bacterium]|nr:FtsX-like permease family protein [Rhodothermales bacterium]
MSSTAQSIFVGMRALRSNPLRAMLSTLGVIIGVASLVAILSIGDSLEQFSRDQIVSTTDLQSIQLISRTDEVVDGVRIKLEDPVRLSGADFGDLVEVLGPDATVVPTVTTSSRVSLVDDSTASVSLVTHTTAAILPTFASGMVRHGRFLSDGGNDRDTRDAVISMSLANRLAGGRPDSLLVGEVLIADSSQFRIVGILDGDGEGRPRMAVPIDVGGSFGPAGKFPSFTIRAETIELVESTVDETKAWLDARFGNVDRDFIVQTSQARVEQVTRGMLVFKLGLGAIAAISLIVGGIGIMNVLLASVAERTREIGVRKAVGAKKSDILIQFLAESVSITGAGALLGALLGLAASAGIMIGIKSFTGAPVGVTYTWTSIVLAAIASIVIGLVFGTFPALRASRLSPVDAIRHE